MPSTDTAPSLEPVWASTARALAPALPWSGERAFDVVVVGAGIVGATAARELAARGSRVALVEAADRVGCGVTGQSTAKVTAGHGLRLSQVRAQHGQEAADEYASAAVVGLAYVRKHGADAAEAQLAPAAHDLYCSDREQLGRLIEHVRDATECGLTVEAPALDAALPYPAAYVVRYPDQLLVDPVGYVRHLVDDAVGHGVELLTGVTAHGLGDGRVLRTSAGSLRGEHVLLTTHVPFPVRSLAFALVEQQRHYAVAGTVDAAVAMSYDVSGGWSTRPLPPDPDGSPRALVVGPGHATGRPDPTASMHRLHVWAQSHLDMRVTHAWSTQDAFSTDGLPLVGGVSDHEHVLIATGFGAWGLTLGTAAALDLVHAVVGEPVHATTWSPRRGSLVTHPTTSLRVTARTAANLAGSVAPWSGRQEHRLSPGQGTVVRERGEHVAVSRDADGVVRAVSARCTHLRCLVAWNAEASTWDCECHGSRFAPDGRVLHGPATEPLEDRAVPADNPETD